MSGVTLDAGALVAFEKNDRRVVALLARALETRSPVVVPAGVVGQVWRDGRKQARLARLLASPAVAIEPLDDFAARAAGSCVARPGPVTSSTRRWSSARGDASTRSSRRIPTACGGPT